jgi:hypothetical protein
MGFNVSEKTGRKFGNEHSIYRTSFRKYKNNSYREFTVKGFFLIRVCP